MEMTAVQRRTFLATTVAGVGGLLTDRLPGGGPRLDDDPLTQLRRTITDLRFLDGRDGAASVLMPASWLANRLLQALAGTPPQRESHTQLASLAADAAEIAGWAAFELGEYGSALAWYDRSLSAAMQAGDLNFTAFASESRAQVLWLGLKKPDAALAALDAIRLDGVTPDLGARVHICRARVLAARRNEPAAHRAIEAAAGAVSKAATADGPWAGWASSAANVKMRHGLVLADLGYGAVADKLLTASLRNLPTARRRAAGTIHCGLARAAILNGEPERAAEHVVKAHTIFTATKSRQLHEVGSVSRALQARYPDVRAVRQLEEQLRTGTRYMLCATSDHTVKIHQSTCQYARRGAATPWSAAQHLDPAKLVSDPIRGSYELCVRCMPV